MADTSGGYAHWVRTRATDSQIIGMREQRDMLRKIADAAWAVWSEGQCAPRTTEEHERFDALAEALAPYAKEIETVAHQRDEERTR